MNKMVINHLDKLFVTNDAAIIVNELEVQHLAAKILVLAARAQQDEIDDDANLTICFAGELIQNAEELIRMGLLFGLLFELWAEGREAQKEA
ncbi:hypothetical protein ACFX1S_047105 [Malus domestica]